MPMLSIRRVCVAALAFCAAVALNAPRANAITTPVGAFGAPGIVFPVANSPGNALAPCTLAVAPQVQAGTAGTINQACLGSGLSFIGPSIGQVAAVIGPTIIGPVFLGNSVVAAGNAAAGA
jgi:hypothetical protein